MSRILTNAISCCLIGGGVLAWSVAARPLVADKNLDVPLNTLGINGSPYGEVFAMAMQGPIDSYFHGFGNDGGTQHDHKHEDGKTCSSCVKKALPYGEGGVDLHSGLQNFLVSLDNISGYRTNPKAATETHKFFLRRQIEDKLRFAYQFDPSHYANYNSLSFFLTEPQLSTRPQLTPAAAKLADDTINYCLKRMDDPRPMLTAAAAATNVLQLMFNDQSNEKPVFTTQQMRQYLKMTDYCLARYVTMAKQWDESKNWDLLSPQRITECDNRFTFISKIREAAEQTIIHFESKSQEPQVFN
ncbi:MAG: hypothetical protein EOP84_08440 [Verrucomicrobiaceae bacterium]|nr:MAG: hypothetical protein EOP84_08440 [Verrucomicrobiaceae bacterium]